MATLREVYEAKKEFINDDAKLEVVKGKGGYGLSLWHDREKFFFGFTVKNRSEFFDLIIELFNSFDFTYYVGGDINDLRLMLEK